MLRSAFRGLMLLLLTGLSARAYLTLRYTTESKTQVTTQRTNPSHERIIRIKGDKTQSTSGALTVIFDNVTGEITLLNPATRQYARMPSADFVAAARKAIAGPMPATAQLALQNLKFDIENKKTGQMRMVAGFRAEEHLMTMAVSVDVPGAAVAPVPVTRVELRTWVASPDESNRIPFLREYAAYVERALAMFNTDEQVQNTFRQIPGLGEKVRAAIEETSKDPGSLTVKIQATVSMPAAGPNAPLIELRTDLVGVSTDAIDDSVFEVPADYQMASSEEIFKALAPKQVGPSSTYTSTYTMTRPPTVSPDSGLGQQVWRIGAGVSAPVPVYRQDPEYTEEARRAKVSGAVRLSVVVDKEGLARNIVVVESLDPGLDQKAIEAVRQWRFRPAQKDGQPVNVRATIVVNFQLVLDPHRQ